jgi:hypothetical protein
MRVSAGIAVVLAMYFLAPLHIGRAQTLKPAINSNFHSERLTFDVEWRLIHAGTVVFENQKSHGELRLDSAGMVSTMVKIHDQYSSDFDDGFCGTSSIMDSQEGKHHREAKVTFDHNHATYLERDVIKDAVLHTNQIDIPSCVHEVAGAMLKLRSMTIDPGQSSQIPMSDGRRSAQVRVEAQDREDVKTPAGAFKTVRYEAYLLNGVIYSRKGRTQVWLTDDARHLPVKISVRMNFPIGTVTLQLQKEEHL